MPYNVQGTRDKAARLVAEYHRLVVLLTEIFQAEDPTVGEGVCRGFAAKWIGAQIEGFAGGDKFRFDHMNINRPERAADWRAGEDVVAYHHAYQALQQSSSALVKDMRDAYAKYEKARRAGKQDLALERSARDAESAFERAATLVQKKHAEVRAYHADFKCPLDYLKPKEATKKAGDPFSFQSLRDSLQSELRFDGVYFIGLTNHALAFYLRQDRDCLFFDANTGEWWADNMKVLSAFFRDYMRAIYGNDYLGTEVHIYYRPFRDTARGFLH